MLVLSSGCNPPFPYLTLKRVSWFFEEHSEKRICKSITNTARLNSKVALEMNGDAR